MSANRGLCRDLGSYQREVRETQIDELIYKLYMEENFSYDSMIGFPYLSKVDEGVNSGEESTV